MVGNNWGIFFSVNPAPKEIFRTHSSPPASLSLWTTGLSLSLRVSYSSLSHSSFTFFGDEMTEKKPFLYAFFSTSHSLSTTGLSLISSKLRTFIILSGLSFFLLLTNSTKHSLGFLQHNRRNLGLGKSSARFCTNGGCEEMEGHLTQFSLVGRKDSEPDIRWRLNQKTTSRTRRTQYLLTRMISLSSRPT